MILWILFCRMNALSDTLFTFYAKDREDAERKAEKLLGEDIDSYDRLHIVKVPLAIKKLTDCNLSVSAPQKSKMEEVLSYSTLQKN